MSSQALAFVLDVTDIHRSFAEKHVLKGVSLQVKPGEIKALLGPNGAGKTTLAKICGLTLLPDAGSLEICGVDALRYPKQVRQKFALVTGGELGFYGRATARENLLFFADLQGISRSQAKQRVHELLTQLRLDVAAEQKVHTFSRGMKQRLHLARGLLSSPELLLLDEITSGLDPEVTIEVRQIIKEIACHGTAVLLTTHLLHEVEALADSVAVLLDGKIAFDGTTSEFKARVSEHIATQPAKHTSNSLQKPVSYSPQTLEAAYLAFLKQAAAGEE